MRPIRLFMPALSTANASLFYTGTPVSGTALTLLQTIVDVAQRRIALTYGNESSQRLLVIKGTNWQGDVWSETLTIPANQAGGTVVSQLDYLTLTSAVPQGGGWTANATLGTYGGGTTAIASTPWARLDDYGFGPVSYTVAVTGSSAANCTVQRSADDPNNLSPLPVIAPSSMVWVNHPNLVNITASAMDYDAAKYLWAKMVMNSGNGPMYLIVDQAGGKGG
jgi:hypothetical protein